MSISRAFVTSRSILMFADPRLSLRIVRTERRLTAGGFWFYTLGFPAAVAGVALLPLLNCAGLPLQLRIHGLSVVSSRNPKVAVVTFVTAGFLRLYRSIRGRRRSEWCQDMMIRGFRLLQRHT
jgi:hypothetical protein